MRIQNIQEGQIDINNLVYFDESDYSVSLNQYIVRKGDIVIAMSGATTGKIGVSKADTEYYLNQRVGKFIPKLGVITKRFLYHLLTSYSNQIYEISSGTGAQPNLSSEKLKRIKVKIPTLANQQKIADILDRFDKLCNDISDGLPAEIAARKKQYVYYRDKLLTFKPLT